MIHDINLLLEIAAASVTKLTAGGSNNSDFSYLDYVCATLGFANGIIAALTASKVTHCKIRSIIAHCKNSFIEIDFLKNAILIHRNAANPYMNSCKQAPYKQDEVVEKVSIGNTDKLGAELEHFVSCIRREEQLYIDGRQAINALGLASLIEHFWEKDLGTPVIYHMTQK